MKIYKSAVARSDDDKHFGNICRCENGMYVFHPAPGDDNSINLTAEALREIANVLDDFNKDAIK